MPKIILGIESSCDETSVAIYDSNMIISHITYSQEIHKQYGGVLPEQASRKHLQSISKITKKALQKANMTINDIDGIAVTNGPGLIGALLVGVCFAKGLSKTYQKPIISVDHLDAHIYSILIEHHPPFPWLCLIASGGHTQLVYIEKLFNHDILGKTRDDAAGEAYDKIGKMLGLSYPAGKEIDILSRHGNPHYTTFPQPLKHQGLDFSFSGLKTSVFYFLKNLSKKEKNILLQDHFNDICSSINHTITEILLHKLQMAIHYKKPKSVILCGGVACNAMLRQKTQLMCKRNETQLFVPSAKYCTDNGAMVARTGALMFQEKLYNPNHNLISVYSSHLSK